MGGVKKEYMNLPCPAKSESSKDEKPVSVLGAAVKAFASCPEISPIIITIPDGGENSARACLPEELFSGEAPSNGSRILFATGGPTRRASVHNALLLLETYEVSHVLIHDGARPWVSRSLIEKIIEAAMRYGAAIPALPLTETPKELEYCPNQTSLPENCGQARFIKRHLKRADLCCAQTPQGFKFPEILRAHEKAEAREKAALYTGENLEYTDDAGVWGEFAAQVAVIAGDPENRKITYPEDVNRLFGQS